MKVEYNCKYYENDTEGCNIYGTPNCEKCPNLELSEMKMKKEIATKLPQGEALSVLKLLFGDSK